MLSRIQVRQFLAVVDTGSFTRAANALHVAQPSLSGGIAEMERQLGTRLFVRERRRIQLTEAGNLLLPMARSIERKFQRAEAQIGNLPAPARPIRLGVLESLPSQLLQEILSNYAGHDPLELVEGGERELHSALVGGAVDLAITLVPSERLQQQHEILFQEDYCLALPSSHPLANETTVDAADVAGETMLARRSCEILGETSRFFTERGVRPRFALRSANDDRVMALVRSGMGITVAPRSYGGPGVAMVRLTDFDRSRAIGLVYGKHWFGDYSDKHPLLEAARRYCEARWTSQETPCPG